MHISVFVDNLGGHCLCIHWCNSCFVHLDICVRIRLYLCVVFTVTGFRLIPTCCMYLLHGSSYCADVQCLIVLLFTCVSAF